jgi:hypothetical protein
LKNGNARFRRGCKNMTKTFRTYNRGVQKGRIEGGRGWLENGSG